MRADRKCSAQIINVVRCYLPQPEDGEYPERDFVEVPKESGSAAPATSRASARHANVDRVKDSEDLGARSPSSGDDDGAAIPAKPLDVRPPLRAGKRALPNFGLDTSYNFAVDLLSWTTLSRFDCVVYFRYSIEETSASLGDRERFQFRPHDSTLEQTADSQEKDVGDAALENLPKSSPPPKKNTVEPDLILVSSSGEPSGSKCHVSPKILSL
jgi:hypothetical protein